MNPWPGIATLVTRRDPDDATRGALWPEQSISLMQALHIFTVDGARALRRSAHTGSLATGKSADLIVLDRDLFTIAPAAVAGTEVEMTIFEGRVVHQRAAL